MHKHKELEALIKGASKADRVGAHEYFVNRFGADSVGPVEEYLPRPAGYWKVKENVIASARECKTLAEWTHEEPSAIGVARKQGWFEEATAHMPKPAVASGHWTRETCLADARTFQTKREWQIASKGAYDKARKSGWYEECCAHMPERSSKSPWNRANVLAEAQKHKTVKSWRAASEASYSRARVFDMVEECKAHMRPKAKPDGYWTKERCMAAAKEHKTRAAWYKASRGSVARARINGWYEECCAHMPPPQRVTKTSGIKRWTNDLIAEDAKKYTSVAEWRIKRGHVYAKASQLGIRETCMAHMFREIKPQGYWTKERCMADAKKYKFRKQWTDGSPAGANAAHKGGWYEECCAHMGEQRKPQGYWTKERCIADARKHKTRSQWHKSKGAAAVIAKVNGWYEECCAHMPERSK